MCKSYMRISRERIDDFEWLSNPHTFYVFMRLLFKAKFKDTRWEGIDVKRGQLVTGRRALSSELNLSERQIRTCLDKLWKTGYIDQQTTNKYTIITICNYDSWVNISETNDQQNVTQTTNKRPTNDQQTTTLEIKKESKEIKEEDTNVSKKKDCDELFEKCWVAYNRKGLKKKAKEYWDKLKEEEKQSVLPHIRIYVNSRERQYQKDFERYLRDKVFNEIIVQGNSTIFDPSNRSAVDFYSPVVDGIFQIWDNVNKRILFNGDIDNLDDGYTSDNRPNGATAAWGMYEWKWSKEKKKWIKQ